MMLLSFPISTKTPMYGNSMIPMIESCKSMNHGDTCNQTKITISQHTGTHVDAPFHFVADGKTLTDFEPAYWLSSKVAVFVFKETSKDAQIIDATMFQDVALQPRDAEFVLLKTGFGQYRGQDRYWQYAPGFAEDLGDFLRSQFPKIKFFGFDLISLSSYQHRELGRRAHKNFLKAPHPIMIVEDMDLHQINAKSQIRNILVSPLFVEKADGSPCSIWANAF